jgi:hypothetical protein
MADGTSNRATQSDGFVAGQPVSNVLRALLFDTITLLEPAIPMSINIHQTLAANVGHCY